MTQGKLSVTSKPPSSEGQGDKKDNATAPPAPPSYEEATAGEGMKSRAFPAPPAAPLHPSWAYVDPSTSPSYGSGGYPGDTELLTTFSWDDQNVRRVFIRKVYAILMVQLLVTVVIVAFFTFCEPVKGYIQTHSAWYWASYAVFFVTYLILACCSGPRRYFPWNLILLSIFTLSMAYLTAMLSSLLPPPYLHWEICSWLTWMPGERDMIQVTTTPSQCCCALGSLLWSVCLSPSSASRASLTSPRTRAFSSCCSWCCSWGDWSWLSSCPTNMSRGSTRSTLCSGLGSSPCSWPWTRRC
ncbi:protein lifeguard 2 isoform X2 [Poecile atricapillus]|uniref:protein lifeguard 2 isoform X2 n=1 Tax=Poecile atricapillus TaxID=48891 RepID=UPI002739E7BA|nr:protein lifeguard 2 isoform X2 [Poecile atricapillus]